MKKFQSGFNLIEVLIAMVILAVGLLGIAGLQMTGVRANQGSYYRSQAASIMTDIAERMHSNLPGINAGAYSGLTSTTCGAAPTRCAQENAGAPASGGCTPQQMAAYDFYVVACGISGGGGTRVDRIRDVLPNGFIRVDCIDNSATPAIVTGANCRPGFRRRVTATWEERTQANAGNASQAEIQTQTMVMTVQP